LSAPQRFDLRVIVPQPWKNGAGLTREIAFAGVSAAAFDWRVSVAEVDRAAPFSAFVGIDRSITLLSGAGMRLRSHDGAIDHALTTTLAPFQFPGDVALAATLVGGACTDFNVMTRRGEWRSDVQVHRGPATIAEADALLLLCCSGTWLAGDDAQPIGADEGVLWRSATSALPIRPTAANAAMLTVRLCHDRHP